MRGLVFTSLAFGSFASAALNPVILADHNYDGKVDILGETDNLADKCDGAQRPAVFLPAITDTDRRCSKKLSDDAEDEDYDKCHDGTDNILRHSDRLAPIRTRPIDGAAGGTITISYSKGKGGKCLDKVRVFRLVDGEWVYLSKDDTFSSEELSEGLVLGIDGRDVIRPDGWDGRVRLNFKVWENDRKNAVSDCIQMKVSPILTHHHAQAAERVFTSGYDFDRPAETTFREKLEEIVAASGVSDPVYYFTKFPERWPQDIFEPGYTSIPGPDGPIGFRVMIRSSIRMYTPSGVVFDELRDANVGAVQYLTEEWGGVIDGNGNLETIPPYRNGDSYYPAGRNILGAFGDAEPVLTEWLQAQGVQDPVILDSSWLMNGHVDEFIQFLPFDNERGWVVGVADPLGAYDLLLSAVKNGHGDARFMNRPELDDESDGECSPLDSISQVLNYTRLESDQRRAASRIEVNLQILKNETGLSDDEIVKIPVLYYSKAWECETEVPCAPGLCWEDGDGGEPIPVPISDDSSAVPGPIIEASSSGNGLKRRQMSPEPNQMGALLPNIVNSLVLPNGNVFAANPWGPVIGGVDIVADAARKAYAAAGHNVTFVDEYTVFHLGRGNVHCGTNSWREFSEPWWQ